MSATSVNKMGILRRGVVRAGGMSRDILDDGAAVSLRKVRLTLLRIPGFIKLPSRRPASRKHSYMFQT